MAKNTEPVICFKSIELDGRQAIVSFEFRLLTTDYQTTRVHVPPPKSREELHRTIDLAASLIRKRFSELVTAIDEKEY